MHLLQSGVGSTLIELWLGHESQETAPIYVEADSPRSIAVTCNSWVSRDSKRGLQYRGLHIALRLAAGTCQPTSNWRISRAYALWPPLTDEGRLSESGMDGVVSPRSLSPTMRQEFFEPRDGMIFDTHELIFEPGKRIDPSEFAGGYEAPQHARKLTPLSLPKEVQLSSGWTCRTTTTAWVTDSFRRTMCA